jgi:hypothetical protein
VSFSLDGPATVYRNGTEVAPENVVTVPNVISFEAGPDEQSDYAFTASEAVVAHESMGSLEDGDTVSGTSVSGSVQDDVDAFRFAGDIQNFELTGSAVIDIDRN